MIELVIFAPVLERYPTSLGIFYFIYCYFLWLTLLERAYKIIDIFLSAICLD